MTKTELQSTLAEATQTDKRTRWSIPGYAQRARLQRDQEERRICFARFWQTRKAEEEGTHGL